MKGKQWCSNASPRTAQRRRGRRGGGDGEEELPFLAHWKSGQLWSTFHSGESDVTNRQLRVTVLGELMHPAPRGCLLSFLCLPKLPAKNLKASSMDLQSKTSTLGYQRLASVYCQPTNQKHRRAKKRDSFLKPTGQTHVADGEVGGSREPACLSGRRQCQPEGDQSIAAAPPRGLLGAIA